MNKISLLFSVILVLLIASCSSPPDIQRAKSVKFENDIFKERLRQGYIEFTEDAWKQKDKEDALFYSKKAKVLSYGINPSIADLEHRNLPEDKLNELAVERNFLVSAFAKGIYSTVPEDAAEAQLMLDCWVDAEEENKFPEKIKHCKNQYFEKKAIISEVLEGEKRRLKEREMALMAKEKELEKQKMLLEARMVAAQRIRLSVKDDMPEPYIVFFAFNSDVLTKSAQAVLDKVLKDVEYFKPDKILSSGHTDTVGGIEYNYELSGKRGKSIANYLISRGINSKLFDIREYGENDLRAQTADEKKEQANRYGKITFTRKRNIRSAPVHQQMAPQPQYPQEQQQYRQEPPQQYQLEQQPYQQEPQQQYEPEQQPQPEEPQQEPEKRPQPDI